MVEASDFSPGRRREGRGGAGDTSFQGIPTFFLRVFGYMAKLTRTRCRVKWVLCGFRRSSSVIYCEDSFVRVLRTDDYIYRCTCVANLEELTR